MKLKSGYNQVETGAPLTPSSPSQYFISELNELFNKYSVIFGRQNCSASQQDRLYLCTDLTLESGDNIVVNIDIDVPSAPILVVVPSA